MAPRAFPIRFKHSWALSLLLLNLAYLIFFVRSFDCFLPPLKSLLWPYYSQSHRGKYQCPPAQRPSIVSTSVNLYVLSIALRSTRFGDMLKFLCRAFESGFFTDLVITCGSEQYKVHRMVVCPQVKFFNNALKFPGKVRILVLRQTCLVVAYACDPLCRLINLTRKTKKVVSNCLMMSPLSSSWYFNIFMKAIISQNFPRAASKTW